MKRENTNSALEKLHQGKRLCTEAVRLAGSVLRDPKMPRRFFYFLRNGLAWKILRLKYIEVQNMRELKNLLLQNHPVTFVTSYYRSGNTWMRYLLSDVLLQKHGVHTTTKLAVHPDDIICDFGNGLVAARDTSVQTPGLLLKIHDSYGELRSRFSNGDSEVAASFKNCRYLYLFRAPEDALVSFYQMHLRERHWLNDNVKNAGDQAVDVFCRESLAVWIKHVSSYLEAAENGVPIYFTSYELLLADTESVLDEALQWMGVPHTQGMLERATLNMQFTKLKASDNRLMGNHGRSGAGSCHLQPETVEFIRERTAHLMARLNSRARQFHSPHSFSPQARNGHAMVADAVLPNRAA